MLSFWSEFLGCFFYHHSRLILGMLSLSLAFAFCFVSKVIIGVSNNFDFDKRFKIKAMNRRALC